MRKLGILIFILFFVLFFNVVQAETVADSDSDGVSDVDELAKFHTDPKVFDTDSDGFGDGQELRAGFSPLDKKPLKLEKADYDHDGLSDRMELNFGTDLTNPDSDGDGFSDGEEIKKGFDPMNKEVKLLSKRIEINIARQELSYYLGGVRQGTFKVSSGKRDSTPRGHFKISNKSPKAWSHYGLWMPWWMGLNDGKVGIHELPVWPNGYVEGENHLGKPVSHGCVRLGKVNAKLMYDWTPVGTGVFIY